jgi:sulfate adenylyltransferase large subunit
MNVVAIHPHHSHHTQPILASGLLRFITAGSVDDGKSTLIGRLLYDTGNVASDQVEAIRTSSARRGFTGLDLSLLTDGLQAEREQGITIDVAYRYFATTRRKFIIGDAPGHEQYTRNMVTAASTADLAILMVDARKGIITQTRRQAYLAHLLGIRKLVLAINKMDLVDWRREAFDGIVDEFDRFAAWLGCARPQAIPLSALNGENVVKRGQDTPWYRGPTLLEYLHEAPARRDVADGPLRFPVQRVVRVMLGNAATAVPGGEAPNPMAAEFRGYQGTLGGGELRVGDTVRVLPSGRLTRVGSIKLAGQVLTRATADQAVVIGLEDDIDLSRGDMLVDPEQPAESRRELTAELCWLAEEPLQPGRKYLIKHTTRTVTGLFPALEYRTNVNTLEHEPGPATGHMNDIVRVRLRLQQPLFVDPYARNRTTGSFIVIDPATRATLAAGIVAEEAADSSPAAARP